MITEFSRELLLRDGSAMRVRLMRQGDRQALRDLFARCSPESIRFRFLSQIKELTEDMLDLLTSTDGSRHIALVIAMGEGRDERIVSVGRYQAQPEKPDVAEVSFLVEDTMQRRGIGTLLLDTLAELARERGVKRFSADVLADNRQMLSVFRKAGYALSATTSYGVTQLEFPIAQTELAQARAEAQEAEAERASLGRLLAPKSVAVIGASRDPKSVGGALFQNLLRWRFVGVVYPINPSAKSVAGVRAYSSIKELPEAPELVFVAVPASSALDAARQCAAAGVRSLCVISAGFAETGAEGKAAQDELLSVCRSSGMRLVGPNCMGLVNASDSTRMLGTFAPADPPAGSIAISSESGALGLALLNQLGQFGLGVSTFASIGNRADVSGNDLLQYWETDDSTEVILLYLESFGNPRHFARIARRVARRKPIVAVKSGRTPAGARAASSHTAALASSDRAADALFAQTGIIRVNTLMEFFSVARLLASQPIPAGDRIGILTNAGGPAILAVDAAEAAGLKVPNLGEATKEKLRQALPATAAINNPVDMVANAGPEQYRACLEALCDEPGLDAILVIFIPPLVTPSAEVARVISDVVTARSRRSISVAPRPIVAVFLDPRAGLSVIDAGECVIPVYDFPEGAIAAISAAARYGSWRAKAAGHIANIQINSDQIDRVMAGNPAGKASGWLSQADTAILLEAAGIELTSQTIARSAEEAAAAAAKFNRPVAMKIHEPSVLHKSDVGGIALNIPSSEAVNGYQRLATQLAAHGIQLAAATVAPMAKPGVEVLAGVTNDPVFGPLVAFGSGGVMVELFEDVVFRVLPLTDRDVSEMIEETRVSRLLKGYRGSPPADVAALEHLLLALGALAEAAPRIAEIDLNPVIVHPKGEGVTLIDARVRLSD